MKNDEIRRTLRFLQWTALTFILTLGLLLAYDMYRSRAPIKQAQDQLAELKQQDLADAKACSTKLYAKIFHGLLERGHYIAPSQFECNFVSAVHTPRDVDRFLSAFEQVLKKL
jgi:glutamate-1-semialdehyde 2,1-aminomutase